jgi:hypothetical protein
METIKINELLRTLRDDLYEQTKHLTNDELIAYYHQTAQRVTQEATEKIRQRHSLQPQV